MSASTSTSKRKLSHVSRACLGCRRKRSKCSGGQPCDACKQTEEECTYTEALDGRKAASKTYVEALHQRIRVLEGMLEAAGLQHGGELEEPLAKGKEKATDEPISDSEEATAAIDSLKIEDGDLRLYGSHSVFAHLPQPGGAASPEPLPSTSYNAPPNFFAASSPSGTAGGEYSGPNDWSKHLPRDLIDEELHDRLLDLFDNNDWFGWTSGSAGEGLFRRDLARCIAEGGPDRTSYYSPMLHNAVLALATVYCPDPRLADGSASRAFAATAKSYIEMEVERPMLSTVQGLMVLGSVHSGVGRHGAGYYYAGGGLRLSTTLGLGLDTSPYLGKGLIDQETKEERERGFWLTFIQDKLWSSYVGRPPTVTSAHYTTRLPTVNKAKDDRLWHSRLPSEELGPGETRVSITSYASTTFHWTARLAILSEKILDAVYSLKVDLRSASTRALASDLHLQLGTLLDQIPPAIQVSPHSNKVHPTHVLNLHLFFWFEMLLLHRPFVPRKRGEPSTSTSELAVKSCEKAVAKLMQLLLAHRRCPGLQYAVISLTQMTLTAGRYHLYIALHSSDRGSKKALTAIANASICVELLDEMPWQCAKSTARELERLIAQWNPTDAAPSAPKEVPMGLDAQALDPQSELAKQLKALGWTPPVAAPQPPVLPPSLPPSSIAPFTFDSAPLSLRQQQPFFPISPTSFSSSFQSMPSSWPTTQPPNAGADFSFAQSPPLPSNMGDPFATSSSVGSAPDPFADAGMLALFESQAAYGMPVAGGWAPAGYGGVGLGQQQQQWEAFAGWDQGVNGGG